ncbi:MAG: M15 family metallopeptidase domain-containing protein [Planctomycetota bacterium]
MMTEVRDEVADISILTGHRGEHEQNQKFDENKSKVRWPDGKHNSLPSKAVDFQPYPLPRKKEKLWAALAYIAGRAMEIGKQNGLTVRWGGDWNGDGDLTDQNFDDLYHLEVEDPNGLYETDKSNMGGTDCRLLDYGL